MTLKLRDYQREAADAVLAAHAGGMVRPSVVLPTGTGKTVLFADLVRSRALMGGRSLVLAHREELIDQSARTLGALTGQPVGVVKAERSEVDRPIIVGSVATLARENRRAPLRDIDFVIVDEAHHASAPSYVDILTHYGSFDRTPTLGVTATMTRTTGAGLGTVWQDIVYSRPIEWFVRRGYLVNPRARAIDVADLDLSQVGQVAGDYGVGALAEAIEASAAPDAVVKAYQEHGESRPGILFAPDVISTEMFAERFRLAGIAAEVVIGETPTVERQAIYARVSRGETKIICNCMVLTEGFDLPPLAVAMVCRPTRSAGLFQQMVGRVLRPFPGSEHLPAKDSALILILTSAAAKHRLCTLADLSDHIPSSIVPEDDETLEELEERAGRETNGPRVLERVTLSEVDLFGASTVHWLQTKQGTWFCQTGVATWLIWPDWETPGTYAVGRCGLKSTVGGTWPIRGQELSLALALASAEAEDEEDAWRLQASRGTYRPRIASRSATWRQGRKKPSDLQVDYARALGIATGVWPEPGSMSKAEIADAITIHKVSRMLDKGNDNG